jgi:hypothetical protein
MIKDYKNCSNHGKDGCRGSDHCSECNHFVGINTPGNNQRVSEIAKMLNTIKRDIRTSYDKSSEPSSIEWARKIDNLYALKPDWVKQQIQEAWCAGNNQGKDINVTFGDFLNRAAELICPGYNTDEAANVETPKPKFMIDGVDCSQYIVTVDINLLNPYDGVPGTKIKIEGYCEKFDSLSPFKNIPFDITLTEKTGIRGRAYLESKTYISIGKIVMIFEGCEYEVYKIGGPEK